ncbi:pentatricopeptide repeat-containing protein, partial [Trifolium medium]|nr:pentatricopeptide repeat-containing protein [Trifolium medium]
IEKRGCVPLVVTFNALINGLCKAHKLKEAVHLCSIMERRWDPDLQKKVEQMCEAGNF